MNSPSSSHSDDFSPRYYEENDMLPGSPNSWEDFEEDSYSDDDQPGPLIREVDEVFGTLQGYLDRPLSAGIPHEPSTHGDSQSGSDTEEQSGTNQMLTLTRNLASRIRSNFQGIPITPQQEPDEPASPTVRTRNQTNGQVFNFTVVLLDPGDDSIPRGNARQQLRESGRLVELTLSRGTQETGALRALNNAFPFLSGVTSNNGDNNFEVLTTDRSSRNLLVPVNRPTLGFSARELKKISGQGSLYLRLLETTTSESHLPRRTASRGRSSSRGLLFRQEHLPALHQGTSQSRQARTLPNNTPLSPSTTAVPGSGTNRRFRRRVPVSLSVTHTLTSNTSPRISTRPSPVDTGATGPVSGSSRQSRGRVPAGIPVTLNSTRSSSRRISTQPNLVDTGATGPGSSSDRQSRVRVPASVRVTSTVTSNSSPSVLSQPNPLAHESRLLIRSGVRVPVSVAATNTVTGNSRPTVSTQPSSPLDTGASVTTASGSGLSLQSGVRVPVSVAVTNSVTGNSRPTVSTQPNPLSTGTAVTTVTASGSGSNLQSGVRVPVSLAMSNNVTGNSRPTVSTQPDPLGTGTAVTTVTASGSGSNLQSGVRVPVSVAMSNNVAGNSRPTVSTQPNPLSTGTAVTTVTASGSGSNLQSGVRVPVSLAMSNNVTGNSRPTVSTQPDPLGTGTAVTTVTASGSGSNLQSGVRVPVSLAMSNNVTGNSRPTVSTQPVPLGTGTAVTTVTASGSGSNLQSGVRVPVSVAVTNTVTGNSRPTVSTQPNPLDTGTAETTVTGSGSGLSLQSGVRVPVSVATSSNVTGNSRRTVSTQPNPLNTGAAVTTVTASGSGLSLQSGVRVPVSVAVTNTVTGNRRPTVSTQPNPPGTGAGGSVLSPSGRSLSSGARGRDGGAVRRPTSTISAVSGSSPTITTNNTAGGQTNNTDEVVADSSSDNEEVQIVDEERGRRWRATLPPDTDSEEVAEGSARSSAPRTSPDTGTRNSPGNRREVENVDSNGEDSTISATVITSGAPGPSILPPSAAVTGTIELLDATALLDLLPQNHGDSASALASSIQMTHSVNLPFSHPCNFPVLMEMARMEGEQSRPALICVCSERQWGLWRNIFENSEIATLVNENFLFWVQPSNGSVGKEAMTALKDDSSAGVMAVVYSVNGINRVLLKISGPPSVSELKRALEEALKEFIELRNKWLKLQEDRRLRREQDIAYEMSLNADREKEERRRNTASSQTEPPAEPQSDPEDAAGPSNEPTPKRLRSDEGVRIILLSPNGTRHTLDFQMEDTLAEVYRRARSVISDDAPPIFLSHRLETLTWRSIPNEDDITLGQYGIESNSIWKASYEDVVSQDDTQIDLR